MVVKITGRCVCSSQKISNILLEFSNNGAEITSIYIAITYCLCGCILTCAILFHGCFGIQQPGKISPSCFNFSLTFSCAWLHAFKSFLLCITALIVDITKIWQNIYVFITLRLYGSILVRITSYCGSFCEYSHARHIEADIIIFGSFLEIVCHSLGILYITTLVINVMYLSSSEKWTLSYSVFSVFLTKKSSLWRYRRRLLNSYKAFTFTL